MFRRSAKRLGAAAPLSARPGTGTAPTAARSRGGFTLLELLIALVLLALVYTIAMPAIGRSRVSAAVHNSKSAVVSTIQLARATAMRFGRPAVLRLDSVQDRVWIEVDTTVAGTGTVDSLGHFDFARDLSVNLESDRSSLCFDGRGVGTTSAGCPQPGAVIVLSLGSRADTVVVNALGRVVSQ